MSQSVRAISVSPEFWMDQPEVAARLLTERMREAEGTDVWVVCIGPREFAAKLMGNLFVYGPAEPPLEQEGTE